MIIIENAHNFFYLIRLEIKYYKYINHKSNKTLGEFLSLFNYS